MTVLTEYLASAAVDPDRLADLLTDPEVALRAAGIEPGELLGPDPKPGPEEPAMITVTPF
jgi:hypothetical protein